LQQWIANNSAGYTPAQLLEELRAIQSSLTLRPADRIIIFLGAVFKSASRDGVINDIETNRKTLAALARPGTVGANKEKQRQLLAGFEWLCGVRYPNLLTDFGVVLQSLHRRDLLTSDVLIEWARDSIPNEFTFDLLVDTAVLQALREKSTTLVKALIDAEEEALSARNKPKKRSFNLMS
jgi:hypothetical protein